jgi:hypothetical protein
MTTHQTQSGIRNPVDEDRDGLLRLALKLDAAASGALGVLSLATGPVLDDLLGTPLALLVPVGLFLVAWAAALWFIATRLRVGGTAVRVVILLNLLYAMDGVVVVATGLFPLTALGIIFVLFQVAAVTLFAAAQFYALRKPDRPR